MNILQLLNESPLKEIDSEKKTVTKESTKKEALRLFQRNWSKVVSQVELIFKENIERRKKTRPAKANAVNETVISIGGKSVNVNYKYESASKFVTSVMVVGIMLHLSIKYKNYVERWWDEFDKIKALSTEEKFDVVSIQLKKDVKNVDKIKAINLFEKTTGSIKKAQMLFAAFFGKVGFTEKAKEAIEDVKSYSQAHGLVSKAVEVFIKLVFESFDKEIIEQPKMMNRFPDFKVVSKVPRGIFAGVLPGDYIEAKTQTLTTSNLNVESFKQSMGLKGDVITAEDLNAKKGYGIQKTMINLGAAAPRGNKLYYFMRQGTSSNFGLYGVKSDFYRGQFSGEYNTVTKKGQIVYKVRGHEFNLITKGGKVLLIDSGHSKDYKNSFLTSTGKSIDMIGMRKEMGKMKEFKGAVSRKQESKIRQFREPSN